MITPGGAAERSRRFAREWHDGPARRQLTATFGHLPPDDLPAVTQAATQLLDDGDWCAALLAPMVAALAADPWFEPPLRVSRDRLRSAAVLFENAAVSLSAVVLCAETLRTLPPPTTLVFSGRIGITRYVRCGGARLLGWAVPPLPDPPLAATMGEARQLGSRPLADGEVVRHDGRIRAHVLADATGDVAILTATLRAGADPVAREYDAASGRFVRMATTDEGAARAQALLTLLRVSDAADANPCFEAATRDGAFFLRWSAMREWLAHDWRAAWERLLQMAADDPHPEVRAAAAAMVTRLALRRAA